jgi:hypothetical protein
LSGINESTGKAFVYKRLTSASQDVTLQDFTVTIV